MTDSSIPSCPGAPNVEVANIQCSSTTVGVDRSRSPSLGSPTLPPLVSLRNLLMEGRFHYVKDAVSPSPDAGKLRSTLNRVIEESEGEGSGYHRIRHGNAHPLPGTDSNCRTASILMSALEDTSEEHYLMPSLRLFPEPPETTANQSHGVSQ